MAKIQISEKIQITHKICDGCPEKGPQPVDNFYKNPTSPDGHDNKCKKCRQAQAHNSYLNRKINQEALKRKREIRNFKKGNSNRNLEWGTLRELRYIEQLGTHRKDIPLFEPPNKSFLLRHYLEAAQKRVNWADIDKNLVIQRAQELLQGAA